MKRIITIITAICIIGSIFAFYGCSKINQQETKNSNKEIETICKYLNNYNFDVSADFEDEYSAMIENIEKNTNSEFQGDIGSGNYILQFKYDESLSFEICGLPFQSCNFYLNGELCSSYDFN